MIKYINMNYTLEKLNESQILPVKDTEGAVLVIAGAGSGKTRVLTNRIAYLVQTLKVDPYQILSITFTNKAADDMKRRLLTMVKGAENMWICTIHSMCVRILRSAIVKLGYEKNFSIYSEDDKERVLKRIIAELNLEPEKYLKLAKNAISYAKNDDLSPREYKDAHPEYNNAHIIAEIYARYEEELKNSNALDFDDLLVKTLHLLEEFDEVREYYASRFRYIHVDEFQDTNAVQYKIIKMLASCHGNIFVVGDDDQSIYSWRGAQIGNILGFEDDFNGARVYKLEQNYRSTKKILNAANLIIHNNSTRKDKTLWTENSDGDVIDFYVGNEESDEASYVATKIKSLINQGGRASDFAVLMRVNALSRSFEQEFLKYNIPYRVYGGFKFFDRKEIKDLTAYLRVLANSADNEAVLRIINLPRRGIGDKTIEIIKNTAHTIGISVFETIMNCESLPLGTSSITRVKEFKMLLLSLYNEIKGQCVSDVIKTVISKTDFLSQFAIDTEENKDKKLNVDELINSAYEFEKLNIDATLTDYLGSITLSSDTDEMDEQNFVTIATIHSVKGLEFDTVFVVGLDETIFPVSGAVNSQEELEEERRLMYVAITRAKKKLYLTRVKSRYIYGNRSITAKSRFIAEIEPLLKKEEQFNYGNYYTYQMQNSFNSGVKRSSENDFGYYSDEPYSGGNNYGGSSGGTIKSFSSGYNLGQNKKLTTQNSKVGSYKTGMTVKHVKFGQGTVIEVKNEGKVVIVAFTAVGIKALAADIAPLEII